MTRVRISKVLTYTVWIQEEKEYELPLTQEDFGRYGLDYESIADKYWKEIGEQDDSPAYPYPFQCVPGFIESDFVDSYDRECEVVDGQ